MDKMIILGIAGMGGLGFFFAAVLACANEKLKVIEDPKIEEIEKTLPGINCGSCGYLSCHDAAVHLAENKASIDCCKPGGDSTQKRLAAIMGVDAGSAVKKQAVVHCAQDLTKRKKKARYSGVKSCAGANIIKGGDLICDYGCLGLGDCKQACPFDAIEMVEGLPKIIADKCVACGMCVSSCPRKIISLEEISEKGELVYVACSSLDKGALTRKACSVGCISCGICAKLSGDAFVVQDNLSKPDYGKMKSVENMDAVMLKCPTKVIKKLGKMKKGG